MELNELRKIAEAATPGPWVACSEGDPDGTRRYTVNPDRELGTDVCAMGYDVAGSANVEFIATFDPPTVLALLNRLEQAERNADTYQKLYEQRAESLEQAEQAVARMREAATAMANHSLPEAPRGGAWETAHGAQLFAKDILETLNGEPNE